MNKPPNKGLPTLAEKVAHVRAQKQFRNHHCHWPNCPVSVPPAMWGCKRHWFMLPVSLRNKIWDTYRPGQEIDLRPSKEYLDVAHEVQEWIREHDGLMNDPPAYKNLR